MTDAPEPSLSKRGEAELIARREREAAALRANLRRRKDQQRVADREPALPDPGDAARARR